MASTVRSASASVVDQLLTLIRMAVLPCHTVPPIQAVPSACTRSITARANMPGGMYYHTMSAVPALGKVYSMGGYNNAYLSVNYEYDVATNAWSTRAPISDGSNQQPRYGPGSFAVNNRVYVVGGYNNGYTQTTLEYNPLQNSWVQRANMAYQRYLHSAATVGTKGYTYGGIPSYTYGEEYTPPDFGLPPNEPANVAQAGSRAETASEIMGKLEEAFIAGELIT